MPLPKPTVVLFDMDGTTVQHINPMLLDVLEWFDDVGFRIKNKFFPANLAVVENLEKEYDGKRPGIFVHKAIHKLRRKPVNQIVRPAAGILTLLKMLQEAKIPVGLGSNGLGKGYGHDILEQFELAQYYKATVFREDIKHAKPHPELLCKLVDTMGLKLTEKDVVWHIGDREKDIVSAQNFQFQTEAKVIPIGFGLKAAVAILRHNINNDHIIMSYRDFAPELQKIIV